MNKPEVTIHEKRFLYAVSIFPVVKLLREAHRQFDLSRLFLRALTSAYFNGEEAVCGQPGQDFNAHVGMPYHEAREKRSNTKYLTSVNLLSPAADAILLNDAEERFRILGSIQPAMRKKPWLT